mgnify:CR=1 FL=1
MQKKEYKKLDNFIISKRLDYLLIFSPLWFPLFYLLLHINIPAISNAIFILSIFFLAETHFASTWLFLFFKSNRIWIKQRKNDLFVLPIVYLFSLVIFWLINPSTVLIFHYLASGWHVTRQSVAMLTLSRTRRKLFTRLIYLSSFPLLILGLIKPGIVKINLSIFTANTIFVIVLLIYLLFLILINNKFIKKLSKNLLPVLTGILIYVPLLFIDDIKLALGLGVGMHWIQYLGLTGITNYRRLRAEKDKNYNFLKIGMGILPALVFILIYALSMTLCTYFGLININKSGLDISYLYLIPILFQFYHFYIDRYLWKFSDEHIRSTTMPYIFNNFANQN